MSVSLLVYLVSFTLFYGVACQTAVLDLYAIKSVNLSLYDFITCRVWLRQAFTHTYTPYCVLYKPS